MNKNKFLLPWYVNNTLSEKETLLVESWLQSDSEADAHQNSVQQVAAAAVSQVEHPPSRQVEIQLFTQIRQPVTKPVDWQAWAWGAPVAALLFVILWLVIQPGVQLQWSVGGDQLSAFRIYRAPVGSASFELLEEIPAAGQQTYQYADWAVFPGQTYRYRVEAVDQSGSTALSTAVASSTWIAFAAQTAILLTSFMLAFGIVTIVQEIKVPKLSLTAVL